MAEKKSMSGLAAKAVARVKGQRAALSEWGVAEHMACLRYMTLDAIAEAERKPDVKVGKEKLIDAVSASLKAAFAEDKELAYASNFEKLLRKCGELESSEAYE